MSEYQTTATLTAEGTFVVPGPKGLPAGTRAEVTVRVEEAPAVSTGGTLEEFFRMLESRPPEPGGARRAEEAQAFLRAMREEWD